jgi:hypothetical protein
VLLVALARSPLWRVGERRLSAIAIAVTGLGFAAAKLWPPANRLLSIVFGPIVRDPTDLIALPALAASGWWLTRAGAARAAGRFRQLGALALTSLACLATSRPREYPAWQPDEPAELRLGCAQAALSVPKSGKEGLGVTIRLVREGEVRCTVRLTAATFVAGPDTVSFAGEPEPRTIDRELAQYLYVPLAFDNNASWNRGVRHGVLSTTWQIDDAPPVTWQVALTHQHARYFRQQPIRIIGD